MSFSVDARVPVLFGTLAAAGPDDAVLLEGDGAHPCGGAAASFHAQQDHNRAACACCTVRGAAGRALAALLQARARGQVSFFRRVIALPVSAAGRAEILAALSSDPVAASCFRLVDDA